jgi:hypothetical protein
VTGLRITLLLIVAATLGVVAWLTAPRAIDAAGLLAAQGDPAALADRQVAKRLDENVAAREIEAALAAGDADLAQSFVDLAREHRVPVAHTLAERVANAVAAANAPAHTAETFAKGFVTGVPQDFAGLAGTAVGDLFVYGDVRDAVRESFHLVTGQPTDRLLLGLAGVGLAVTASTYATLGTAAPIRVGLTLAKAARKSGRLGVHLIEWLERAASGSARNAAKLDRADGILEFARSIGRVESKAGARAALEGLQIARGPKEMARIARLAAKKGSKTRAILKLLGRGAIVLATGAMQLLSWIVWAVLTLFGFASSAKSAVERLTRRWLLRRKRRLINQKQNLHGRPPATLVLGPAVRV